VSILTSPPVFILTLFFSETAEAKPTEPVTEATPVVEETKEEKVIRRFLHLSSATDVPECVEGGQEGGEKGGEKRGAQRG
jgi:hypothetical protein